MVYCSGQVGVDPATKQFKEGGIGERTVGYRSLYLILELFVHESIQLKKAFQTYEAT